jgi:hypothetical protein
MLKILKRGIETLRQPDRNPRCYEMTEQERLKSVREWNNRNVWNTPDLSNQDKLSVYHGDRSC